jgi:hypothetical protein
MKDPVGCRYWTEPERAFEGPMEDRFRQLELLVEESHWWRYLLECRECGQKYFFEFYEEIDWVGGHDPQYSTYIPVDSHDDIETLKATSYLELLNHTPRLQKDFPRDADTPTVHWVREASQG